jgi:hypothetical protein
VVLVKDAPGKGSGYYFIRPDDGDPEAYDRRGGRGLQVQG